MKNTFFCFLGCLPTVGIVSLHLDSFKAWPGAEKKKSLQILKHFHMKCYQCIAEELSRALSSKCLAICDDVQSCSTKKKKKEKQGRSSRGNQVQPIVQWLPDKSLVVRQIQGQPGIQVSRARLQPARHRARPRHSCDIAQVRTSSAALYFRRCFPQFCSLSRGKDHLAN